MAAKRKTQSKTRTVAQQVADNRSRVKKIREQEREAVRKKFKAMEYVRQLDLSASKLDDLLKDLDAARTRKAKFRKTDFDQLSATNIQIDALQVQLQVVKTKIDLNLRRLRFCLPELKSIELTDQDGDNPYATLGTALKDLLVKASG